jgi:hypothetical protein
MKVINNKKRTDYSQVRHQAMGKAIAMNAAPTQVRGVPTEGTIPLQASTSDEEEIGNEDEEIENGEQDETDEEETDDEGPDAREE